MRVESLGLAAGGVAGRSHKKSVGYQGVDVGVEIKVFAKGVERHDDAGNALGAAQGGAEVFREAFVGEGAEAFEQVAVALEVGAQHSRDSQDIMPVRDRGYHLVEDKPGRGLDVLLVAGRAEPAALTPKSKDVRAFGREYNEIAAKKRKQRKTDCFYAPFASFRGYSLFPWLCLPCGIINMPAARVEKTSLPRKGAKDAKREESTMEDIMKLCDVVRETGFAIHRYHKHGHLEKVYENALAHRLRKLGLDVKQQPPLKVYDEDGTLIGDYHADLLVDNRLIIELKAAKALADEHVAQILGYLNWGGNGSSPRPANLSFRLGTSLQFWRQSTNQVAVPIQRTREGEAMTR